MWANDREEPILERFRLGQRIKIINPDGHHEELRGKYGMIVHLLCRSSEEAWAQMDKAIPGELALFGEQDPRRNYVLFWRQECSEIRA